MNIEAELIKRSLILIVLVINFMGMVSLYLIKICFKIGILAIEVDGVE